jgi:hypothetical protein
MDIHSQEPLRQRDPSEDKSREYLDEYTINKSGPPKGTPGGNVQRKKKKIGVGIVGMQDTLARG